MEWVETTARTVEEAKELALDQLGVVADDADFEILATPKPGLFGRIRGEARVRARVRPAPVRPKQDRRRGRRGGVNGAENDGPTDTASTAAAPRRVRGAADPPAAVANVRRSNPQPSPSRMRPRTQRLCRPPAPEEAP